MVHQSEPRCIWKNYLTKQLLPVTLPTISRVQECTVQHTAERNEDKDLPQIYTKSVTSTPYVHYNKKQSFKHTICTLNPKAELYSYQWGCKHTTFTHTNEGASALPHNLCTYSLVRSIHTKAILPRHELNDCSAERQHDPTTYTYRLQKRNYQYLTNTKESGSDTPLPVQRRNEKEHSFGMISY